MKGGFKTLFRSFCLDGTFLGLKYLYLFPDKISRCFWLTFLALVLYFAVLLTLLLYQRFEAMPTRITIENQFEPVAALPFPAITLCSPNQLSLSALRDLNETLVNGNRSGLVLAEALHELLGFYYFVESNTQHLHMLQQLLEINRYTVPEVMALLPQSCESFLHLCVFRKKRYERCRGLFRPLLTKHGLCCIFNSPYHYDGKVRKRNGRDHHFKPHLVEGSQRRGLMVVTDFRPDDAANNTIPLAGATRVMFTDWTEFPSDDEMLMAAPDSVSLHFIRATSTYCSEDVKQLPFHSRKCALKEEYSGSLGFWEYHNSDCDLLCSVRAVRERCNCSVHYLPRPVLGYPTCPLTAIPCLGATKLNLGGWLDQDKCDCPRDCESRHYHSDVSMGNLNGLPYIYVPLNNLKINKSSAIMHFFFQVPVYEKHKQETIMSLTTVMSNLGGVFGLCMGVSVISLLEILFYQYVYLRNRLRARRRHRRSTGRRRRRRSLHVAYYE